MEKEKILFAWSSGKDSARSLYEIQQKNDYEVIALLTTFTEEYDRVSMHGVRRLLVEKQAKSIGLPLEIVWIPRESSNEIYENRMMEKLLFWKSKGILKVAFGDIFLEDLRKYREENLKKLNMTAIFPIWKLQTLDLIQSFKKLGFKAIVTCVDTKQLDAKFAGREIDRKFIDDLPENVDACGENGEFHSFVYDGPIFKSQIKCKIGEKLLRNNQFYFCDVLDFENEKKDV